MNLKKRVVSGCVAGAAGIIIIVLNSYFGIFVPLAVAFISDICIYELLKCNNISLKNPYFWFAEIINTCFMLSFLNEYELSNKYLLGQLSILMIFIIISLLFCVFQKTKRIKIIYSSIIIVPITVSFGCLSYWSTLYAYDGNAFQIKPLIIFLLCMLGGFVSDTAGFFVGCKFGKHKLAPKISPKKTVEGFIGSVFSEPILFLIAAVVILLFEPETVVNYPLLILASLFCAAVATSGDLAFSAIKRHHFIKDFGEAIPGHGGFLDRFDSVIFTSIYITAIFHFLPVFS